MFTATKIWSTKATLATIVFIDLKSQLSMGGDGFFMMINMKGVETSASENKCKYKHPELG